MKNVIREMLQTKEGDSNIFNTPGFVKKRDGRVTEFDSARIATAIHKAMEASGEGDYNRAWEATGIVLSRLNVSKLSVTDNKAPVVDIEHIQDIVEDTLMNMGFRRTAKAYILYRAKRSENREIEKTIREGLSIIEDYVQLQDWRINENSNMSYSLQGLNAHISSSVTANYWLTRIYTPEIGESHRKGVYHIHDLGLLSAYCVGWDLEQLLINGFNGVTGKVASKPAKHFRTALGQVVNFFYTLQGEAAGAQAFANFDTFLAPFIKHDNLTYEEVKQAMQEFVFNLNVPTRVGFQTPFTNLTFDLTIPSYLKDQAVIIGGELQDSTYGDYKKEMDMLNRAFAEVMIDGDASNRPFTFPIPTYNITKDFQWDNPAYIPIWEMTSRYGTPYFSNFINSDMSEEDARSMCCRLRLDNREVKNHLSLNGIQHQASQADGIEHHEKHNDTGVKRGGLFSANPMTGSIGVVTINLPHIAYLARKESNSVKEAEKFFYERLYQAMESAKTSLEIKRKIVEDLTDRGLYPYTSVYLKDIKKRTGKYWTNHFSTIGLIGMNETVLNFLHVPFSTKEGHDFGDKVLEFMLDHLDRFREETGNLYNLEASPAEGASYRLAKTDKKNYPDIITSGTDDVPYYTNSVHLPVNETEDIFELLDHQDSLQSKFTGGTVIHIFLGEKNIIPESIKTLVKTVANNYTLPYFSVTPTFSICPVHGYISGEHWTCPYPHSDEDLKKYGQLTTASKERKIVVPTEVYSRVVGYYRPVQNWNRGKKQEFSERNTYEKSLGRI